MGLAEWVQQNPDRAYRLLRNLKPIASLGETVVVTRFDDVQEVLSLPNTFGVTYAKKMGVITDGSNFFLGMNDTPTYSRDVSLMRLVVRREEVGSRIKPSVEERARSQVAASSGQLDFVQDVSGPVPAALCADYLGVPGPTPEQLIAWTTVLFGYLFFEGTPARSSNDTAADRTAVEYAAAFRTYLDQLIRERKAIAPDQRPDDALSRCLALQSSGTPGTSDTDIRNNLIGVLIGAVPTTSKCAAQVLDYLLDHPDLLARAQQAARADDDEALRKTMLETLRFAPFAPGILRMALADYTIAKGTWRATTVKRGTAVTALTQSAMMDGREVNTPGTFRLDRPDYQYLHFGYGMHTCFGYHINMVQIPAILKAVLRRDTLAREPGKAGKLESENGFPVHLRLRYS